MEFILSNDKNLQRNIVIFKPHNIRGGAFKSIVEILKKLGGKHGSNLSTWSFPVFVSSQILEEIIYNTCFNCGGLMKDGQALDNTWVGFDDFGGDAGEVGTTISKQGPAIMLKVRKCTVCGHSHT